MTEHLYNTHTLTGLEGQSVVTLQNLSILESSLVNSSDHSGSLNFEYDDDDDVFQCGRCKKKFRSLDVFFNHKREECSSLNSLRFRCPDESNNSSSSSGNTSSNNIKTIVDIPSEFLTTNNSGPTTTISFDDAVLSVSSAENNSPFINSLNGSSIIHLTPSMLGSDSVTFSIPVDIDQHGSLTHIVNSSQLLSVPDNELHNLMNSGSGERYHLSAIDQLSNPISSHGLLLTASLVSSSEKDANNLHVLSSLPAHIHLDENFSDGGHHHHHHHDPNNHHIETHSPSSHMENHMNHELETAVMSTGDSQDNTIINISTDNHTQSHEVQHGQGQDTVLKSLTSGHDEPVGLGLTPCISDNANMQRMTMDTSQDCSINQQINVQSSSNSSGNSNIIIDTETNSKSSQQKNKESISTSSRKCQYCGKSFKKVFNLQQHLRSHTGETPFYCLVCGRGFTQKSNVKKHMQTHKVWPKIKVTLPQEMISVKPKVSEHTTSDEIQMENDQTDINQVEYVVNNVYVCQYCDSSFPNHHKLKTHMTMHKNEKLFKCTSKNCEATFAELDDLLDHIKKTHEVMTYNCQHCMKVFNNLYDLGAHQYTHRLYPNKVAPTARSHRCTKCNSKYATAESLNHHLLTSSHKYPCTECGLVFVCERYLRRHLKIHGTGKSFKCPHCDKSFKTENYLRSHLVIHSATKPFACDICNTLFNRRDKLSRHKRIHENRKKYKCPFKPTTGCEREFYRKDKLKDHLLSHSRKAYICPYCDKSLTTSTRLRQHQVECHPETLASTTCTNCQKIFKTHHHLKIHLCKGPPEEAVKAATPKKKRNTNRNAGNKGNSRKHQKDQIDQIEGQLIIDSDEKLGVVGSMCGSSSNSNSVIMYDCDMVVNGNQIDERESPPTLVCATLVPIREDDDNGISCGLSTIEMAGFETI